MREASVAWGEHSVVCTYRVRDGARDEFLRLLERHWPTLHAAGLVTEEPAVAFESVSTGGSQHDESGTTFIEIFSWASAEAPAIAHRSPAVMAVWEPMGGLVESRNGRPPMEFPRFRPVQLPSA